MVRGYRSRLLRTVKLVSLGRKIQYRREKWRQNPSQTAVKININNFLPTIISNRNGLYIYLFIYIAYEEYLLTTIF